MSLCPNCGARIKHHPDNSCVLNSLIGVLRDRGEHSDKKLHKLHKKADLEAFWNDVVLIIDQLGEGYYSTDKA